MTVTCPRCGRACIREQRSPNVAHYTCPDAECRPYRPPRWLFVLGLLKEVAMLIALIPVVIAKKARQRFGR